MTTQSIEKKIASILCLVVVNIFRQKKRNIARDREKGFLVSINSNAQKSRIRFQLAQQEYKRAYTQHSIIDLPWGRARDLASPNAKEGKEKF